MRKNVSALPLTICSLLDTSVLRLFYEKNWPLFIT